MKKNDTRELIIEELKKRGYNAEAQDTFKNGDKREAIIILTEKETISPVLYTDTVITEADTDEELKDLIHRIITSIEKAMEEAEDLKSEIIIDRADILRNILIGLQKQSEDDSVKRICKFEGLEAYLFIMKPRCNIRVTEKMMKTFEITEEEAWKAAEQNTSENTKIVWYLNIMAEMMGMPEIPKEVERLPMYVVTNKEKYKGAGCILNEKALKEFGEKHGMKKILVLPSSIHKVIIVLNEVLMEDMEAMKNMVTEINQGLDREDILIDRAYIMDTETGEVI